MNNIFLNKFFWIAFFVSLVVFTYVFWFSWLWIWTLKKNLKISDFYIKKYIIDNTPLYTALANLKIANEDYLENELVKNAISTIKDAKYYIRSNIINILISSDKRDVVLESNLKMMEYTLDKINFYKQKIYDLISVYASEYDKCVTKKVESDNMFFDGLYNLDKNKVSKWLSQSANNSSCAEKNRVYVSWYKKIYSYLDYVGNLLEIKYNILQSNIDIILSNLELFRNNNLETLIELRRKIDSFSQFK